tara:strand:- start:2399 stop:2917 length:519 start_codon:yes stop_codon:yes gene_type:complete
MKKKITLFGKKNIDKINSVHIPIRSETIKWDVTEDVFARQTQSEYVNQLYLGTDFTYKSLCEKEIYKKWYGYKRQDITKQLFDELKLITIEQIYEKLMLSKLYCYYCKEGCLFLYKDVLAKRQWTLDRIDNNFGHNDDNVVICCLECNVKRGSMDCKRFKSGKEIKKVNKLF